MEQTEQSNAHDESVTNGMGSSKEQNVTGNNVSDIVTYHDTVSTAIDSQDMFDLFNELLSNNNLLPEIHLFKKKEDGSIENIADTINREIDHKMNEIKQLEIIKSNLNHFAISYVLSELTVVSFSELKNILQIKYNEQLSRLLEVMISKQVIAVASYSTEETIRRMIEFKQQLNPKYNVFYQLCPPFNKKCAEQKSKLCQLISVRLIEEIKQRKSHYEREVSQLRIRIKEDTDKLRNKLVRKMPDFKKMNIYCEEKYKEGDIIPYDDLVKGLTFFNKVFSSDRIAISHIDYLTNNGYFSNLPTSGKRKFIKYHGSKYLSINLEKEEGG